MRERFPPQQPVTLAGTNSFYELKNRFRETVQEMPDHIRECRGEFNYVNCLVRRIAIVCAMSSAERERDFAIIRYYVNIVNDVAEMVEERLVDAGSFLGKYHLNLIREVYIAEPYIYHFNLFGYSGRWAMRVLRIGEMAREFNDMNPIHRKPVFYNDDVGFGCIYGAPEGRFLRARNLVGFLRNRFGHYPQLSSRSKRRQNRLLEKVRAQVLAATDTRNTPPPVGCQPTDLASPYRG